MVAVVSAIAKGDRGDAYLGAIDFTDKHLVPHFTTNIGKTGVAEPAAHAAPDRP